MVGAKEWLDKNEWPDLKVTSDAWSHWTQLSTIMDQYAKEYHVKELEAARQKEIVKYKKYL